MPDGTAVLARRLFCADGLRNGRIAFYFHFYDPSEPMRWTYGEFSCSAVSEMPTRLSVLMPYTALD